VKNGLFKKWMFLFLGIMFLVSSLMPGFTEQLNKLPSLVNHYRHHVEEHDTTNFAEFISIHYGDDATHRNEEDHGDLPLYQISGSVMLVMVQEFPIFNLDIAVTSAVTNTSYKDQSYSFKKVGGIFQPPRLA
jgi:hypothetical protein